MRALLAFAGIMAAAAALAASGAPLSTRADLRLDLSENAGRELDVLAPCLMHDGGASLGLRVNGGAQSIADYLPFAGISGWLAEFVPQIPYEIVNVSHAPEGST